MFCAIWYHFCNLKTVKNTHGGVTLLIKLQAIACTLKVSLLHWCFSHFLYCTDGTKSRKASPILHYVLVAGVYHQALIFLPRKIPTGGEGGGKKLAGNSTIERSPTLLELITLILKPFVRNVTFIYPVKMPENLKVF